MNIEIPGQLEAESTPLEDVKLDYGKAKEQWEEWQARITACKTIRDIKVRDWKDNIDYRRGKPFTEASNSDRIAVTMDWTLTKAKQAQLYSQTPQVILESEHMAFDQALPVFSKKLNSTIKRAKVGVAMDECLPDVINASGIAAVLVAFESMQQMANMPLGEVGMSPMMTVPQISDQRYLAMRVSPEDLLWDTSFTGSDFDDSGWVGHSGKLTWAEAKRAFGLDDKQKDQVLGQDTRTNRINSDPMLRSSAKVQTDVVKYNELFYWVHKYDAAAQSYKAIQRLVFVEGLDAPVINEPWKGQRFNAATGKYVGACRFPIRILTLTYVSNDAIPPSDTEIGRPQVDELIQGRTDTMLQRRHSQPIRWHDVTRLDDQVADNIQHGRWQQSHPVKGNGTNVFGEVARANYPRENFEFQNIAKADLHEQWQVGPEQVGGSAPAGDDSATAASIRQSNFQTRVGYERARVAAFFVGIAEVLGGLLQLYGDFDTDPLLSPQEKQAINTWDRTSINGEFVYSVRPDSTVLLDSEQQLSKLNRLLNMTAQSGFVNVEPIIQRMVELSGAGIEPSMVMIKPQPKPPEQPNIGYSFKGEDMNNPMVLAILAKSGQLPGPKEVEAGKMALLSSHTGVANPPQSPQPGMQPQGSVPPPGPPGVALQQPSPTPLPGDAHPDWNLMPRLNTRRDAGEGHGKDGM